MQYFDLNNASYLAVLRDLFKNLSDSEVEYLFKNSIVKKYQKNEIILSKINKDDDLYILLSGIIQIGYLSLIGRFHTFYYYSQKNFINLLPCLKKLHSDHDCYAFNQVKVLIIPKAIFHEIIQKNNSLNIDLLDVVTARMHYLFEEVKFMHVANLHQKLCRILLNLAQQYGIYHPLGIEIKLKLSQNDLSDLLSTSRQTINKEMKILVKNKIIHCGYENIILTDLNYLENEILLT